MDLEQLDDLSLKIKTTIDQIALTADHIPGVVIIHNLQIDFAIEYMSERGLRELGLSLEEIRVLSHEEYHRRYFNQDDAKNYVPKLRALLERSNMNDAVSFFQQVRSSAVSDWVWHMSSMKLLMKDNEDKPLLAITVSFPVDPLQHITGKVSRLLEENNFLRRHYAEFSKLGQREREILKLVVMGKNANEIGNELFISPSTVETHRKNIKQKLKANTSYQLSQYAHAFDLI